MSVPRKPVLDNATKSKTPQKVDRILAAKQRDASAGVSVLELEVDQLVYALYALTPEETKLVQSASVQISARQGGAAK